VTSATTRAAAPLRLLMLGTVNHPHVEHLALAMHERGFDVVVGGDVEPELPSSVLPEAGIQTIAAPPMRRGSIGGPAAHVRWIRGLGRNLRPHVVHAHWLCGYAAFAAVAGVKPLVAMAWGSDVYRARRLQAVGNRIALRRAAVAMADSQALLDRLVELGARRESTVLVNWGVDLQRFAPADDGARARIREQLGLADGPVILSPRSLMPVYNPRTILAAFESVAADFPDAQLVVKHMGLGEQELSSLPLHGAVRVVGHVPYEQMPDFYRAADVCVSIASSDSSPRSVWEAMACGVPVVLSDLPWVHELIEPDADAIVVPIDAAAVADGIRSVLGDRRVAEQLGGRGRALTEAHRNRATEMDRLADVYSRLGGLQDR
jgi:glycosyltransferase involved in cell wall biosynthesis